MKVRPSANLPRRMIAMFVLLAMLLAPLCAPLCGSRVCANSSTTKSESCHGSSPANDDAPKTDVQTARACGLSELPTAALNDKTRSPEQISQTSATQAISNFLPVPQADFIAVTCAFPFSKTRIESSSARISVLRI
jgi:hypothetical protein